MLFKFPENFIWGSAFSGPQTENAENVGKKTPSVWLKTYQEEKYKFFKGQYCQNDFYHNYVGDIKIAKNLNFNSLRTSIQWSRLIPDGVNIDPIGVEFYNNVINEMQLNGIEPLINLYHFDMPQWAYEMGGWLCEEVIAKFLFYAKTCFDLFGDRVKKWITFNEPGVPAEFCYVWQYYRPYDVDMRKYCQALWNTLLVHLEIAKLYKQGNYDGEIGIVLNITPAIPRSQNKPDVEAAEIAYAFQARSFLDPIIKHEYPELIINLAKKYNFDWERSDKALSLIKDKSIEVDFLGINYYHPIRVKSLDYIPNFKSGVITPHYFYEPFDMPNQRMNKSRNWEIYPYGLYMCIKEIQNNYNNKRFYISENGMGVSDEDLFKNNQGIIQDDYRIEFFAEHLAFISKAIKEGANCFGFHSWTYIDNWSYLNCYKNRYGLVELDLNTNKRIYKKSAKWFADVIKRNSVEVNEDNLYN